MNCHLPARPLIAILLAALLAACDHVEPDASDRAGPTEKSVVRRGNGGDPGSLDPARAEATHEFNVLADLYEGLVTVDGTGNLVAGVAEYWSVSDDGMTYTFRLRRDAFWSSGERVTADHFVDAFQRTLAPDFESAYSFLLHPIRNAAGVQQGKNAPSDLGVTAQHDDTLIIELEAPAAHFLSVLAMPVAFPLPPASGDFSNPSAFVGNGAYLLREWQPGHRIRLEKNDRYHDADSVAIDAVEYYAIEDLLSEFNMYRAGELDITASVPGAYIKDLAVSKPSELRIAPKLGLYYLAFDLSEPPFDDLELRKALSMAIDREVLVEVIGRGEQAAYGIVPDGIVNYEPARYDWMSTSNSERISEARRALSTSEYDSQLTVTLTYDTGDIHEKIALAISAMWRDVLGIDVELDKREWQYFLETRERRNEWQVMRFAWIGDYSHPSTFTEIFQSASPQNLPGYENPAYDDQLLRAATLMTFDAQAAEIAAAEATLLDDYPVAPLYFYVSKHLVSPRVQGFDNNVVDQHPSRYLRLADRPATP